MRLPAILAASLLLLAASGRAAPPDPLAAADSQLRRHSDGFSIDDSAAGRSALDAYWRIATRRALDYLAQHPGATAAELDKATAPADNEASIHALALGDGLIGLSLQVDEMGDALLLARRGGRYSVVWDAAKRGSRDTQRFPALAAWSPDSARETCRPTASKNQRAWESCGPVFGGFLRLPPDRAGHLRFAVAATYAQGAGATVGGQLSLWSWDGTAASPLLVHVYGYMIDQPLFLRLDRDILRVGEKSDFKSFFACGGCDGRQVDHVFRIGPDGVADLGEASRVPELDALDRLIDAMRRGAPTGSMASDQVVETFRPMVDDAAANARNDREHYFSLGMLMAGEVSRPGDSAVLCFSADGDMDKPLLIALQLRKGAIFLAHAAVSPTETCPK